MDKISFIIPSRDNLRYLKWCYNSIRKNLETNTKFVVVMIVVLMELGNESYKNRVKLIKI